MGNNNIACSKCGTVLSSDYMYNFDNHMFCEDCYNEATTVCDNCGERIWRSDAEGDTFRTLCRHCFENCYTHCEDCGRLIHNDEAQYEEDGDYPYCFDCFDKLNNDAIKNYTYKPEPIFCGSGPLYLGVELEVDAGGEIHANAQKLLDMANEDEDRIYIKHDGSLRDGFEIVSHPMSLDYHINHMNWAEIFEKAIEMDYVSHNTKTCGLHVHVSRSAFGKNYDEQEQTIARVVFFVEKHWSELVKFSRRTLDNLNHWAARYSTISSTSEETYKKAKDKRLGRYVAVNLENCNTIEFRLFRGTLRYKTFIATLQLVGEICNRAVNMSDIEIENMSWLDFVQGIKPEKTELIEYLKEKRLFVNEISVESKEM